ncbi:hypothetical protein Tco_0179836 [Tanacetum coccineum]
MPENKTSLECQGSPSSMKTEMNMVDEVDAFIKVPQGWPIANSALKLLSLKCSSQSSKEVSLLELVQAYKCNRVHSITGCSMKGRNEARAVDYSCRPSSK